MNISEVEHRRTFSAWLRTGRWPAVRTGSGIQLKFNPYHDPDNGQFTFAPGGTRSLSRVIISDRRRNRPSVMAPAAGGQAASDGGDQAGQVPLSAAVYRPGESDVRLQPASSGQPPRASRGSNIRAFHDPMTLEQTFPGLRDAPGGAIIALDSIFDFSGPAQELTAALTWDWSNTLINQIREIDPRYPFESLGFPATIQGQMNCVSIEPPRFYV